jgi:hypothetical protein
VGRLLPDALPGTGRSAVPPGAGSALPSYGGAAWNCSTPNEMIDVGGGCARGLSGQNKCTEASCF